MAKAVPALTQKNFTMDEISISLLAGHRFYTTLLSRMVKIQSKQVDTMGVGFNSQGKIALIYNPDFIKENTLEENQGVTVHEILHVFFRHLTRLPKEGTPESKNLDDLKNIATDMAINQLITLPLPKGAIYPEQFKLERDQNAEWYFEELKKQQQQQQQQQQQGDGKGQQSKQGKGQGTHDMWDKVIDDKGDLKNIAESGIEVDREYELETLVLKAIQESKDFDNLPAFVQKEIKEMLKGDVNLWKRELKVFINTVLTTSTRLSYKKANRRFIEQVDYYMPGPKRERMPKLLLARDTSGSVFDDKHQEEFLAEMVSISKRADVYVADCDTIVHQVYKIKSKKDFKDYKGGGGTAFEPIFELAKKLGVDGIVYLTDTYGSFPEADAVGKFKSKTIWATFEQKEVTIPFGKHVNVTK